MVAIMPSKKVLQIKVDIDGRTIDMFEEIKSFYGLKTNAEVVRLVITHAYRDVQRELDRVPIGRIFDKKEEKTRMELAEETRKKQED